MTTINILLSLIAIATSANIILLILNLKEEIKCNRLLKSMSDQRALFNTAHSGLKAKCSCTTPQENGDLLADEKTKLLTVQKKNSIWPKDQKIKNMNDIGKYSVS